MAAKGGGRRRPAGGRRAWIIAAGPGRPGPPLKIAASMLLRAVALVLALVLSWPAFTAHGQAASAVATGAEVAALATGHDGPVGDPLLDDAATAQAEGSPEIQALILAAAAAPLPPCGMAHPRPYAAAVRVAPYLDGPQRPPSARLA